MRRPLAVKALVVVRLGRFTPADVGVVLAPHRHHHRRAVRVWIALAAGVSFIRRHGLHHPPAKSRIVLGSRSRRRASKPPADRTRVTPREMPKRLRPYGSAVDAESAALARGRLGAGAERGRELAAAITARDVASQAAEAIRELHDLTSDAATSRASMMRATLSRTWSSWGRTCRELASSSPGSWWCSARKGRSRRVPARILTSGSPRWSRRSRPRVKPRT